jgi:hypothetical protein
MPEKTVKELQDELKLGDVATMPDIENIVNGEEVTSTEIVKTESVDLQPQQQEMIDLNVMDHNQQMMIKYADISRDRAMTQLLTKPKHWNNFNGKFRPTAPSVSGNLARLGINKKVWVDRVDRKEDGSILVYATCQMWFAQMPSQGVQVTAATSSFKPLFAMKKGEYIPQDKVLKRHEANIVIDACSKAMVNCFCEFLGIKNIDEEDFLELNPDMDIKKINKVNYNP